MKINLLINTKITNYTIAGKYIKKDPSNFDIFLACLISLKSNKYNKIYIYIDLDPEFISRKDELLTIIKSYGCDYEIKYKRLYKLNEYQDFSNQFCDNEYILYLGNHDHILLNYKKFELVTFLMSLIRNNPIQFDSIYLSHFPEILSRKTNFFHINNFSKIISTNEHGVIIEWNNFDSVQLFKSSIFHKFWISQNYYGNNENDGWTRSDDVRFSYKINNIKIFTLIPNFEILRHYDGYDHANIFGFKLDKKFINQIINPSKNDIVLSNYKIFDNKLTNDEMLIYYKNYNRRIFHFSKDENLINKILQFFLISKIFIFDIKIYFKVSLLNFIYKLSKK